MKEGNDFDFVSLLQDGTFLKLVKDTDGLENQLDILQKEFQGQREAINYALEFIRVNLSEQKKMPLNEAEKIWLNIRKYGSQGKGNFKIRFIGYKMWKVAAALIIIIATSVVSYRLLINKDPLEKIAAVKTNVENEAMIILSDGSKHKLRVNESNIKYSPDGGEIVVKENKQEEKLENLSSSKAAVINQIIVPYGSRHTLTLCDGTRVQLNSGSRLVFPAEFSGKNREVFLIGEGYFDVSKNPDKPFIVKTDFIDIKVLGTIFNISAYEDEQMTFTVLVEGKVALSQKNKLFGYSEKMLNPGQGCFYSSTTFTSDIRDVNVYEYVSWKDGILLFKDKPLTDVVKRVERYYNKRIVIEDDQMKNTLISGKLVLTDDADESINYLVKTLVASYEKNEDGSFIIKNANN